MRKFVKALIFILIIAFNGVSQTIENDSKLNGIFYWFNHDSTEFIELSFRSEYNVNIFRYYHETSNKANKENVIIEGIGSCTEIESSLVALKFENYSKNNNSKYIENECVKLKIVGKRQDTINVILPKLLTSEYQSDDFTYIFTRSNYRINKIATGLGLELKINTKPELSLFEKPEFIGGNDEFRKFVDSNFRYRNYSYDRGKAMLCLTITPDSTIKKVIILKFEDTEYIIEMLKFLKKTDKQWIPAKQNGKPIYAHKLIMFDSHPMCGMIMRIE